MDISHIDGAALITLTENDVGEQAAQALGDQLSDLVDRGGCRKCVVSLSGVHCLSSTQLGKLISWSRRLRQRGGKLTLCALTAELDDRLKVMHLDKLLHICQSEEEALGVAPAVG